VDRGRSSQEVGLTSWRKPNRPTGKYRRLFCRKSAS
jgi:hypothetical protein